MNKELAFVDRIITELSHRSIKYQKGAADQKRGVRFESCKDRIWQEVFLASLMGEA